MSQPGDDQSKLPLEVQRVLGFELRAAYESWAHRVPWSLVLLARRIRGYVEGASSQTVPDEDGEGIFDPNLYDPETIAILVEAFDQAWNDLQAIDNPASKEVLARSLRRLVQRERIPSRLATKAVLQIILPPGSQNARLPV
jgi:hypothetical protein